MKVLFWKFASSSHCLLSWKFILYHYCSCCIKSSISSLIEICWRVFASFVKSMNCALCSQFCSMQRERYLVLCQCDGQFGRTFNLSKPSLKTFVDLLPEELDELKKAEMIVERQYGLLKKAYRLLMEFSFRLIPDSFGGYGLHYNGETNLAKKMRLPIYGYIETIPQNVADNFTNLSVLAARQGSKLSRVMVGSMRLVIRSWKPNCEYKAIEISGRRTVEIVTLRKITPGSELLTF